ncbi:hypothetical protein ABFX02_02G100700 [Erythranthe guttata]
MDIPKLYNSSQLLTTFILWFIFIYIIGYFIIFKNWNHKYRSEASSCLMSLSHGTPVLVLSISSTLFLETSKHSNIIQLLDLASPNTPFHNLVLEYSIAYFLTDLLHYTVLVPSDALIVVHHLATLYVLITCRYLFDHGAVAILGVLVLAEVTSFCQNTWSLARYRKADSANAAGLFELLSPWFYGYYSVVRGVFGPVYVYKMGLFFTDVCNGGVIIPRWGWISWIVVIVVGIGVSILWVLHLWIDLFRQRFKKKIKKLS